MISGSKYLNYVTVMPYCFIKKKKNDLTISPCCISVANKTQFADREMTLASPTANLVLE